MKKFGFFLMFLIIFMPAAQAVEPSEVLADPALESRARSLSAEIRCLVCQNQSIDDSNADLARDLRLLVRERLVDGDSDQAVLDYLSSRYGDFILLTPPLKPKTLILWFGPLGLFAIAFTMVTFYFVKRRLVMPESNLDELSPGDALRLKQLLKGGNEKRS